MMGFPLDDLEQLRIWSEAWVAPYSLQLDAEGERESVRLQVDGRVKGHVHHLKASGVRSVDGRALWHDDVYYTLNEIPAK